MPGKKAKSQSQPKLRKRKPLSSKQVQRVVRALIKKMPTQEFGSNDALLIAQLTELVVSIDQSGEVVPWGFGKQVTFDEAGIKTVLRKLHAQYKGKIYELNGQLLSWMKQNGMELQDKPGLRISGRGGKSLAEPARENKNTKQDYIKVFISWSQFGKAEVSKKRRGKGVARREAPALQEKMIRLLYESTLAFDLRKKSRKKGDNPPINIKELAERVFLILKHLAGEIKHKKSPTEKDPHEILMLKFVDLLQHMAFVEQLNTSLAPKEEMDSQEKEFRRSIHNDLKTIVSLIDNGVDSTNINILQKNVRLLLTTSLNSYLSPVAALADMLMNLGFKAESIKEIHSAMQGHKVKAIVQLSAVDAHDVMAYIKLIQFTEMDSADAEALIRQSKFIYNRYLQRFNPEGKDSVVNSALCATRDENWKPEPIRLANEIDAVCGRMHLARAHLIELKKHVKKIPNTIYENLRNSILNYLRGDYKNIADLEHTYFQTLRSFYMEYQNNEHVKKFVLVAVNKMIAAKGLAEPDDSDLKQKITANNAYSLLFSARTKNNSSDTTWVEMHSGLEFLRQSLAEDLYLKLGRSPTPKEIDQWKVLLDQVFNLHGEMQAAWAGGLKAGEANAAGSTSGNVEASQRRVIVPTLDPDTHFIKEAFSCLHNEAVRIVSHKGKNKKARLATLRLQRSALMDMAEPGQQPFFEFWSELTEFEVLRRSKTWRKHPKLGKEIGDLVQAIGQGSSASRSELEKMENVEHSLRKRFRGSKSALFKSVHEEKKRLQQNNRIVLKKYLLGTQKKMAESFVLESKEDLFLLCGEENIEEIYSVFQLSIAIDASVGDKVRLGQKDLVDKVLGSFKEKPQSQIKKLQDHKKALAGIKEALRATARNGKVGEHVDTLMKSFPDDSGRALLVELFKSIVGASNFLDIANKPFVVELINWFDTNAQFYKLDLCDFLDKKIFAWVKGVDITTMSPASERGGKAPVDASRLRGKTFQDKMSGFLQMPLLQYRLRDPAFNRGLFAEIDSKAGEVVKHYSSSKRHNENVAIILGSAVFNFDAKTTFPRETNKDAVYHLTTSLSAYLKGITESSSMEELVEALKCLENLEDARKKLPLCAQIKLDSDEIKNIVGNIAHYYFLALIKKEDYKAAKDLVGQTNILTLGGHPYPVVVTFFRYLEENVKTMSFTEVRCLKDSRILPELDRAHPQLCLTSKQTTLLNDLCARLLPALLELAKHDEGAYNAFFERYANSKNNYSFTLAGDEYGQAQMNDLRAVWNCRQKMQELIRLLDDDSKWHNNSNINKLTKWANGYGESDREPYESAARVFEDMLKDDVLSGFLKDLKLPEAVNRRLQKVRENLLSIAKPSGTDIEPSYVEPPPYLVLQMLSCLDKKFVFQDLQLNPEQGLGKRKDRAVPLLPEYVHYARVKVQRNMYFKSLVEGANDPSWRVYYKKHLICLQLLVLEQDPELDFVRQCVSGPIMAIARDHLELDTWHLNGVCQILDLSPLAKGGRPTISSPLQRLRVYYCDWIMRRMAHVEHEVYRPSLRKLLTDAIAINSIDELCSAIQGLTRSDIYKKISPGAKSNLDGLTALASGVKKLQPQEFNDIFNGWLATPAKSIADFFAAIQGPHKVEFKLLEFRQRNFCLVIGKHDRDELFKQLVPLQEKQHCFMRTLQSLSGLLPRIQTAEEAVQNPGDRLMFTKELMQTLSRSYVADCALQRFRSAEVQEFLQRLVPVAESCIPKATKLGLSTPKGKKPYNKSFKEIKKLSDAIANNQEKYSETEPVLIVLVQIQQHLSDLLNHAIEKRTLKPLKAEIDDLLQSVSPGYMNKLKGLDRAMGIQPGKLFHDRNRPENGSSASPRKWSLANR